jgi:hypothetical protein
MALLQVMFQVVESGMSVTVRKYTDGDYFGAAPPWALASNEIGWATLYALRLTPFGLASGELAFLNDTPRAATVVAATDCMCLRLDKQSFNRMMGSCEKMLRRNIKGCALLSPPPP